MKCLYKLTLFQFSDQQENVKESTSKTSRNDISANEEGQNLLEIERQRLCILQNNSVLNIDVVSLVKLSNKV